MSATGSEAVSATGSEAVSATGSEAVFFFLVPGFSIVVSVFFQEGFAVTVKLKPKAKTRTIICEKCMCDTSNSVSQAD